jgi:formylglycine-generating enzyme required for sulfatase activity
MRYRAVTVGVLMFRVVIATELAWTQPPGREAGNVARAVNEIIGKDGVPMTLVPGGPFTMGQDHFHFIEPFATLARGFLRYEPRVSEEPKRTINVDAFYMDRYEVTTSRYEKFLNASKRTAPDRWAEVDLSRHNDRPVIGVNWHDAEAYCRWLGKRLPSEAEWEKAARGTDGREFPWGSRQPDRSLARYYQPNTSDHRDWKGYGALSVVGSYEAGKSPYGLYDMAGSVWEWVADYYDRDYYKVGTTNNPRGPQGGSERVMRGGSWGDPLYPIYFRWHDQPGHRSFYLGFRCAQGAPQ